MNLRVCSALAILAAAGCSSPAQSGPWKPSRTVEFIVAAGPGGGSDQLARTVQSIVQKYELLGLDDVGEVLRGIDAVLRQLSGSE